MTLLPFGLGFPFPLAKFEKFYYKKPGSIYRRVFAALKLGERN